MKNEEDDELDRIIAREYENFEKMCPEDQNPVLSVLRVHLLTEYYMERIFHLLLPRGDNLSESNLSYAQKISLLEALDEFDNRTIQCLKNLNKVRNRCAHEYDKIITLADVELIGRPLGREHNELHRKYAHDVNAYLREILNCICRDMVSEIYGIEIDALETRDIESPKEL